jgi:GMP synthase-like glutamine amidotransferase
LYGIRFHSELTHTPQGKEIVGNFTRQHLGWQEGQDDEKEFILTVGGDMQAA